MTQEKSDFLTYLERQQGYDYILENEYIKIPLETIIELENNHYLDFKELKRSK